MSYRDQQPHLIVTLTRRQLRAARALAGMGVRELSRASGLSPTSISQIETGKTGSARRTTMRDLQRALEHHGVEFGPNGWIRHRDDDTGVLVPGRGPEPDGPSEQAIIRTIEQAIHERHGVCLHYLDTDNEMSELEVDPFAVHYVNGRIYLAGWCHTRDKMDSFLLSRIRGVTRLARRFDRASHLRILHAGLTRLKPTAGHAAATPEQAYRSMARTIGSACKRMRRAAGLTQESVGKAAGVSRDFYARIERGVSLPSLITLMRIATALQVSVDVLVGLPALSDARRKHRSAVARERDANLGEMRRLLRNASPSTLALVSRLLDTLAPAGDAAEPGDTAEAGDTAEPG